MSDKLKIQQDKQSNTPGANVITVTPRRKTVLHRGMFGIIEFHPAKKYWSHIVKFVYTVVHRGESKDEEHATLEVKRLIDQAHAGKNKHVRTIE